MHNFFSDMINSSHEIQHLEPKSVDVFFKWTITTFLQFEMEQHASRLDALRNTLLKHEF